MRNFPIVPRRFIACICFNGIQVAESATFNAADYDLASDQPLRIGFGANDYFCGKLRDVRLYQRALNSAEIAALAKEE